ncbi:hypothetical protein HRM2_01110 [Desulforapulum autotrophicum HRM2]|uniref:Uncharacterized protein n=1 Tax=Desulforapulum autotrophicum (strain ATCC 43914 / DSM 3382 / VKM B-1955 / HRM2) TaxID=177437 RepID=C0QEB7_DESAH|nr:hypothetical protein HRM2_01110 [Desulforapulum autotrophicum HRM2]
MPQSESKPTPRSERTIVVDLIKLNISLKFKIRLVFDLFLISLEFNIQNFFPLGLNKIIR